ncbi:hypothetical protein F4779DRAFT_7470 [Xylariaceae sp. FL0662B]|nr:hypothetical protein F4779DRAFT_7470 [Xylariaceae sp. FL0662B]
MEHPEIQIPRIIYALTQYTGQDQAYVLNNYFLPDASFIHPFCRVPSFKDYQIPFTPWVIDSRWFIFMIYRWYHVLSPNIKLRIESTSFDIHSNLFYVTIHQTFTLWFIPFSLWQSNVKLVTVLSLAHLPVDEYNRPLPSWAKRNEDDHALAPSKLYFIRGQEDHYQIEEFVKFVAPWGASLLWKAWQVFSALICALGALVLGPLTVVIRQCILGTKNGSLKGL